MTFCRYVSICIVCCCTFFTACANSPVSLSTNGEMATPYHIYYDAQVAVSPVRVFVHPNVSPSEPLRGLFVPLRVTQDIAQPRTVSRSISRQLWQVWVSQKSFEALEYDERYIPNQVSDALELARQMGANVLVGGYITHYLNGGTVGDSEASIQMEIYEVATGNLLWSLAQGGSLNKEQAADLFLVGVQSRMPADPASLTARSLAYDMGKHIVKWTKPFADQRGRGQAF